MRIERLDRNKTVIKKDKKEKELLKALGIDKKNIEFNGKVYIMQIDGKLFKNPSLENLLQDVLTERGEDVVYE